MGSPFSIKGIAEELIPWKLGTRYGALKKGRSTFYTSEFRWLQLKIPTIRGVESIRHVLAARPKDILDPANKETRISDLSVPAATAGRNLYPDWVDFSWAASWITGFVDELNPIVWTRFQFQTRVTSSKTSPAGGPSSRSKVPVIVSRPACLNPLAYSPC